MFKEIGRADELGSGIRNIYEYYKNYSDKKPIFDEYDVFKCTVFIDDLTNGNIIKPVKKDEVDVGMKENDIKISSNDGINDPDKGTDKATDRLSENQKKIIDAIVQNPYITSEQLSKIVRIRADKIRVNISKLKN